VEKVSGKLSDKAHFGEDHRPPPISVPWRDLMVANRKRCTGRKFTDPKGNLHRFASPLIRMTV